VTGPLIIEKEGIINARPDEVWKVIVTSEYFNQWMFVQPQIVPGKTLEEGAKLQWINDEKIPYLEGEVIDLVPNKKLVISLQDISWNKVVAKRSVTYEFDLTETENGTKIRFRLGDLSVDPEGQSWYDAYNSSDEIGAIERIIMKPDKTE
jgi:uncharacterized protein YndB with AHSA1/START domain